MDNVSKNSEEDFEAMLNDSLSGIVKYVPGQMVEAKIISISGESIFLQLGGKSEGILDSVELTDKEGNLTVKEGDTIKAFFQSAKNGEMNFTTKISGDKAGKAVLENAFNSGIPVEGTVVKENKGGYEVTIGDSRAFCPYSQIALKRVENPEEYFGKTLTFKILEYSEGGRNILVSSRALLEEAQKEKIGVLKKTLTLGLVVKGTVKSLQDFGAFVDIDGVQALLPISEICRSRVEDIHKVLEVGQEIEAAILNLDWDRERISVSMKQLLADPWDDVSKKYKNGSEHKGKIVRLINSGAFVTLEPGLDGFIYISDFESETRISHPKEVVKVGQSISVVINSIDLQKKRISLKPVTKTLLDEESKQYMETENDTYNPFANMLKTKPKKKK